MAVFHGKSGSATFNGVAVSRILNWSLNLNCDFEEATDMGDTWKSVSAGYKSWSAVIECNADDAGLDPDIATDLQDDDGATLVLNTGLSGSGQIDYYTGTGIVTGISPSVDKDGIVKVTYTIQGSGSLTEHTVP